MSNIPLDFVGLNTLVKEEIDPNTNTIGKTNTKAIDFGEDNPEDSTSPKLEATSLTGYKSTGPFSFSFWAKINWNVQEGEYQEHDLFWRFANYFHFHVKKHGHTANDNNLTAFTLSITQDNTSAQAKTYSWFLANTIGFRQGVYPGTWEKWGKWINISLSWDGSFESSPTLYIDGVGYSPSSATTYGSGVLERFLSSTLNIGGNAAVNTGDIYYNKGQMQHLVFYTKTLNQNDVDLIHSNGFIEDITKIPTLTPFIIDYWKLGDELSLNIGDTIEAGTVIEPTYGQNSLTSAGILTVSKGRAPEIRNKEVLLTKVVRTRVGDEYFSMNPNLVDDDGNPIYVDSDNQVIRTNGQINAENYLVALNIHRNGPYGYSSFKQIRAHENPVTKYHIKNNIFSFSPEEGITRTTIKNGKILSKHADKFGPVANFENETPVIMNKKPFEALVNVFIEQGDDQFEEKVKLKTSFAGQIDYFKNETINEQLGLDQQTHPFYEEMKSLYMGVDPKSSIVTGVDSVKLSQTIFPTDLYTNKSFTKQRPDFNSGFWRDNRADRTVIDVTNGFGHSVPSQSMWPLDAVENFETQTLAGSDGSFRLKSLSRAISSDTEGNATNFNFVNTVDAKIFFEHVDKGQLNDTHAGNKNAFWVDDMENAGGGDVKLKVEPAKAHLYDSFSQISQELLDAFTQGSAQYDSSLSTITINTYTRKGCYLAAGSQFYPNPTTSRVKYMRIVNIYLNHDGYRQHWRDSFTDTTISFWGTTSNNDVDRTSYGTFMIDFSSSKSPDYDGTDSDFVADSGPGANAISGSGDITALRRHIFFATSSTNTPTAIRFSDDGDSYSGYTGKGDPQLVVRLGTTWTKNDGTTHYGNTPEEGAVDFIFDGIYTINNPLSQSHAGTTALRNDSRPLKYLQYAQSHFLVSLSQSAGLNVPATTTLQNNCYLAINGQFMSASQIVDEWGFLTSSAGSPREHTHLSSGYTASNWTAATASDGSGVEPSDVIWFQGGDAPTNNQTNGNNGTSADQLAAIEHAPTNYHFFSDIAVFSGSFKHHHIDDPDIAIHDPLPFAALNNSASLFTGISGSQAGLDGENIGIRYVNYSTVVSSVQGANGEIKGPFVWYNFERDHLGNENTYQYNVFGFQDTAIGNSTFSNEFDYSASMGYQHADGRFLENQNINGFVGPVTLEYRLNDGSFTDYVLVPGDNVTAYTVELNNADSFVISNFNSPTEPSVPLGGARGDNSRQGPGVLQNSYSQFARNLTTSAPIDAQLSASAFYSRRHTLTASTSVVNPFFTNLSGGVINDITSSQLYLGTALWEAPQQAGFFNNEGTFVSSPKTPFYDNYGEYSEEIVKIGKGYSVIPEFKISNQIEHYLSQGPLVNKNDFLELTGGLSTLQNSSQSDFYKIYTNSEFVKHFKVVRDDHKKMFDPYKVTLSCKAIKKFLPYKGFYPAERTVEMAQQFYSSYGSSITVTSSTDGAGSDYVVGNNYPVQYLLNPLFGPGILYNTIKSGIACDYPVITSELITSSAELAGDYFIDKTFDTRMPFEALVEPEKFLANTTFFSNEPDPNGNTFTEVLWNGQGNNLYKLQMNNFLAEVGDFFLENENYSTITSLPQGDPNFGNAEGDKVYSMRLKMYRTITGSKEPQEAYNGIKFGLPQDTGSMGEAFTMYSRPSAFGPPVYHSASSFTTKAWNTFKKTNSVDFAYVTSSTYIEVTSSRPDEGFNWPFTPPYYHGEAWADITFKPTETKKHTLPEIINNSSVEFYRYFRSGSYELYDSGSVINNEIAMQIASSMNIFSKGVLRQDITEGGVTVETQFENKYRWIIQSKFECPTLNFNHHSHDTITMPTLATSSVPIGMWHQYGRIPQSTNEGIFVQVEEIPKNWTEGAVLGDVNRTGSLLNLCGFSTDPVRIGEIKESKLVEEAVVAIPFIANENYNRFFNLPKKDVRKAIKGQTDQVGETISNLVTQLRKYVFPPQFDFVNFKNVDPIVMYVFEFSHAFSRQDLADIWQNLPPKIGRVHEVSTASISHELFSHEFFGKGARLTNAKELKKVTALSKLEDKIQWMVFKVKKRARNNYFEKMFDRNESGADITSEEIVATALGKKQKISYNWPYDFFSLVELIKIDADIEFGNVDNANSLELDDVILQPTPPTSKT